jgi:hypothetical protein
MNTLRAGAVYFMIAFAAGWVLGPVRVLWVEPRLGPTTAVMLEAPLMLTVSVLAARWVIRHFEVPGALASRIGMGTVALTLLLLAELLGGLWLRGQTLRDYLAHFGTAPGLLALAVFAAFAALPIFVMRHHASTD